MLDKNNSKKNKSAFNKLFHSIDNLLAEEKEQKFKIRLGKEIRNSIFTNEIVTKLNENDFSGLVDEEEDISTLFSSIFPIFIKKDNVIFRLYKHKIEVDLSDEMSDRYIYMFSDGRLTSGLFKCFTISDDEYFYGIKKIIDAIPYFKAAILKSLSDFKDNANMNYNKIHVSLDRGPLAEKNYNELLSYLNKNKDNSL